VTRAPQLVPAFSSCSSSPGSLGPVNRRTGCPSRKTTSVGVDVGTLHKVGVEGTGSYDAALARTWPRKTSW
jgi:hypothetical protein